MRFSVMMENIYRLVLRISEAQQCYLVFCNESTMRIAFVKRCFLVDLK